MDTRLTLYLAIILSLILNGSAIFAGNAVWWEGESVLKHDFVEAPWLKEEVKKTRLSKMDWLCLFVPRDAENVQEKYSAEYEIEILAAGEYDFWVREFYRRTASPWRFRFDDGEWTEVSREQEYQDIADLGKDRSAVWCKYGPIKLSPGKHRLYIEVIPQKGNRDTIAGFDCFMLIDEPFSPQGWIKPAILSATEYIGTFVWIEGEDGENNFTNTGNILPRESGKLSEGKWLPLYSPTGNTGRYRAKWKFVAPLDGSYNVWIREYSKTQESPFRYRFNIAQWQQASPRQISYDRIRMNEKDSINWVRYDNFFLLEGENTFEIEVDEAAADGAVRLAIDAICLSIEPFFPVGKHRPDKDIKIEKDNWTPFYAGADVFISEDPVLDLRKLNDRIAGQRGQLQVDKDGLVFPDASRPRFWGINAYRVMQMDESAMDYFAEQMARRGVNLVRVRGSLSPNGAVFGRWDKEKLANLHYFVAACRKQGIYIALAIYSPTDYRLSEKSGFDGFGKDKQIPYGMLFCNPDYRERYKRWTSFLNVVNPHTKISLAQDPAIAWFEIQHNDSLFGVNAEHIPEEQLQLLETPYNQWLMDQHGAEFHILRAWSIPGQYHPVIPRDGSKNLRCFRLLPPDWFKPENIRSKEQMHFQKRKQGQLDYLSRVQHRTYTELLSFLRDKRGLRCLVSASSAELAAAPVTRAIEHWTNTPGDIINRTGMLSPLTKEAAPDELNLGLFYESRSGLKNPFAAPLINANYRNKADIVSEISWPMPNDFRGEASAMVAAYGSLHDTDAFVWYEAESSNWASHLEKFSIQTPAGLGTFPGYAMMFRRGDLQSSKPVITQGINLKDQFEFRGTGFDVTAEKDEAELGRILGFQRKEYKDGSFDPAMAYVGKIERAFINKPGFATQMVNIADYHDRRLGIIRSTTGEITLNYRQGVMTINSPRAQAAVGFLKDAGKSQLNDISVSSDNEYANILAISLNEEPLAQSSHILIQAVTREENFGWKAESSPNSRFIKLMDSGEAPLLLEKNTGSVTFPALNAGEWQGWILNANGRRIGDAVIESSGGMKVILPQESIYIELKKK